MNYNVTSNNIPVSFSANLKNTNTITKGVTSLIGTIAAAGVAAKSASDAMSASEINGRLQIIEDKSTYTNNEEPIKLTKQQEKSLNKLYINTINEMKKLRDDFPAELYDKLRYELQYTPNTELKNILTSTIDKYYAALGKNGETIPVPKRIENFIKKISQNYDKIIQPKVEEKLVDIEGLSIDERRSLAVTEAWKTSGLKRPLGNLRSARWPLAKLIAQKQNNPNGKYSTENLVNAYFSHFSPKTKSGNPIGEKWQNAPAMNNSKKMFLSALYKIIYDKNWEVEPLIGTPGYEDYGIKEIAQSVENLENHYLKSFMHEFWSIPGRKKDFSEALKEAYKKYGFNTNTETMDLDDIYVINKAFELEKNEDKE